MRRTRISILCAAVLAAVPASAEAGGLGSVVGAVANAPRTILGGLFGGGQTKQHRQHARHAPKQRSASRPAQRPAARAAERSVAQAAPVVPANGKPTNRDAVAFWPSAYDDVFGYVLMPGGHAGAFWSHGYADVTEAMFARTAPMASTAAASKSGPTAPALVLAKFGELASRNPCAEAPKSDAAFERLEQTVQPTDAQRAALVELKNALRGAAERLDGACATDVSGGPSARLEAVWRRLRALRQAVTLVRAPLKNFYGLLSEEQKARLDALGPREGSEQALRTCGAGARMPEWPTAQIAQTVRPTDDQRPSLELLMGTSLHFAHQLRASCSEVAPLTPVARLEAADQRLTAMVYGVTVLRGALTRFYSALTEEQRARLDAMGTVPGTSDRRRAEAQ